MKIKARWRKTGLNPFQQMFHEGDFISKTVEVDDDVEMKQLEQFAKDNTQEGYEFIEVVKL